MNYTKKLQDATDKVQNECHEMVREIMSARPETTYQDATNVYLFSKLAQLELMIENLNAENSRLNNQ